MSTLEIQLPDDVAMRLGQAAERLGVTPEEFLRISLEDKLAIMDEEFNSAADYVLAKNAELYERLA